MTAVLYIVLLPGLSGTVKMCQRTVNEFSDFQFVATLFEGTIP